MGEQVLRFIVETHKDKMTQICIVGEYRTESNRLMLVKRISISGKPFMDESIVATELDSVIHVEQNGCTVFEMIGGIHRLGESYKLLDIGWVEV